MSSRGSPARYRSMARWRRCSCACALVDSLGACGSPCQIALCSRCHGPVISVGAAHQAAAGVRTGHGSLACRRVAAACRGAGAWSAPAGNGVRATGVGRHAAGGGAPVRPGLPRGPSGLTPRAPCGCGPSPSVATGGTWPSAWAPPARNRPARTRAGSARSPRPALAGGAPASHADSTTAPRSPRPIALGASEEPSRHDAAAPPSAQSCGPSGAAQRSAPQGLETWPVGRPGRPDDGGEARWARPQPPATSQRRVRCPRAHGRSRAPPTRARSLGGPARAFPVPATRLAHPAPSARSPRVQAPSTPGAARVGTGPTLLAAAARAGAPLPKAAPTPGPPGDVPARRLRPAGPPAGR
jgi:hypothetical protein